MFPGLLEAGTAIFGAVAPTILDVVKTKVLGIPPESGGTLSTLAKTNPEMMEGYVRAKAELYDAEARFFNRDISGTPSTWVTNLRAIIRPGVTFLCTAALMFEMLPMGFNLDTGTRATMCLIVSSWFGQKLNTKAE